MVTVNDVFGYTPPPCFCTVCKHAVNGAIVVIRGEVVLCAIIGCSKRSPRDKCHFYKLPAIITHQGQQMLEISTD